MEVIRLNDGTAIKKCGSFDIIRYTFFNKLISNNQKTILACGSIRGGTSILGYLLHSMGLVKGDNLHQTTHEDLDFENQPSLQKWKHLIKKRDDQYDTWALKLPAITKHMEFFEANCRNPIFIVMFRNPLDLTLSILKRDDRTSNQYDNIKKSYAIGSDYYNSFFNSLNKIHSPLILCRMEEVTKDPKAFITSLAEELQITLSEELLTELVSSIAIPGYKKIK